VVPAAATFRGNYGRPSLVGAGPKGRPTTGCEQVGWAGLAMPLETPHIEEDGRNDLFSLFGRGGIGPLGLPPSCFRFSAAAV